VLKRHVEIGKKLFTFIDELRQLGGDRVGMKVHEPYPLDVGNFGDCSDESAEACFHGKVAAVPNRVLGDEHDFLDARGREAFGFFDEDIQRFTPEAASDLRNSAIAAQTVASIGYFQVRVPGSGDDPSCGVWSMPAAICVWYGRINDAAEWTGALSDAPGSPAPRLNACMLRGALVQQFRQERDLSWGDEEVRLGERVHEFVFIAEREAARDHEDRARRRNSEIHDDVDGFLDCRLNKGACIDNDDVRLRSLLGEHKAMMDHGVEDSLRIHPIFRAAKAHQGESLGWRVFFTKGTCHVSENVGVD